MSVAALLGACVAPPPRLPDPGAALLFELHERRPSPQSNKEPKILADGQRFGLKVKFDDLLFALCTYDMAAQGLSEMTYKQLFRYWPFVCM